MDRISRAGHRQIDHTADIALELWAPTDVELLAEAARAVVAIMTDGAAISRDATRVCAIESIDDEDRLVQWINEIIYLAVTEGFLVAAVDLDVQTARLEASLVGEADAADRIVGELKSATYHDLLVEERDGGWWARVVIDV